MANNKKLTKAELNQTLPIPLAKGVLKKTNRGQLLKMLDDLNQKIEIEEVNHHDDCLCDICSEQRITSEAEVVEVSPNVFEQEVNLTDEEIAQQEARKQKTLDNIQKAGERHDAKVTVGGELRSAENTPEVIQDKTPEENAQLDYEHKLKIKAMDYQASLAKAQGNMIQGMVQDYEYRCVEILVEDEDETYQVSKQIECVLDHNAKQAIVIRGDIVIGGDKDMYKNLYKPLNVATPKRGGSAKGSSKGSEINDFIEATLSVTNDTFELKELAEMMATKFGGTVSSYQTRLTDCKNPKYNKLSTLLVEQKIGSMKALLLDTDSRVDRSIAKFHKDHPWAKEEIQAQEEVQETIKVESTNPRKPNGGPVTKIVEEAIAA